MPNPLIYSHVDVDGITSARIAQMSPLYKRADVQFTPYASFGTRGVSLQEHHDALICLDIGCSTETLESLIHLADLGMKVVLIDHHVTDDPDLLKSAKKQPNLKVFVDIDHCTASLTYKVLTDLLGDFGTEWTPFWTIVGIYGDMATKKPGAATVLEELKDVMPTMLSALSLGEETLKKKMTKKLQEQRWKHNPALMVSRAMNQVRRVTYHRGAALCLKACQEVEAAGNPFLMVRNLGTLENRVKYPYVSMMRTVSIQYMHLIKAARDTTRTLDLGKFALSMMSSPADIGGINSNRVAKELGKPAYTLNDGLPFEAYKLSGRGEGINHIVVFRKASEISDGQISGGGHLGASSGTFPPISFWRVAEILYEAVAAAEGIGLGEDAKNWESMVR